MLLFIGFTLALTPGFYNNQWNIITQGEYQQWQMTFDRTVIARLVKSRQDGLRSAGGLLGLGDVKKWRFDNETTAHQIEVYKKGVNFDSYLAYKSNPGFQGFIFGVFDRFTNISPELNLKIFRGSTALLSAASIALFSVWLTIEFGLLPAILVTVFVILSKWMTLPAGSIYWNLWAFYLPFLAIIFLLSDAANKNEYQASKIYFVVFSTALIKILFNGFEAITSSFMMITVPLVYYALRDRWRWTVFVSRIMKLGIVLMATGIAGLTTLSIQIAANDNNYSKSIMYIIETFNRRAISDPEGSSEYTESLRISLIAVVQRYLNIHAITINFPQWSWNVTYFHLILLFAILSVLFFLRRGGESDSTISNKGQALLIATWYSITAPLSWITIFKPTAIIHDTIFPIIWQMPFTLLGFALCGYVITISIKRKAT